MHVDPATLRTLAMVLVFLAGVFVWIMSILLLVQVTQQLLDVLSYVMKLAQLG
jgi:hypothetical protein